MALFNELLVSALIVIGASFALVGSWGLIRLPDLMSRLHAPTKATTLGVGGALVASMVYFLAGNGTLSIHELLISLFLFLTAPLTAQFLAKAWLHSQRPNDLPPAACRGWSTFDAGEAAAAPPPLSDARDSSASSPASSASP